MKRKGSALLRSRVRSSRVSATSPKRKRTSGGLDSRRHSCMNVEARVDGTGEVIMVGMVANALLCDRGRPLTVLRPEIVKRPDAGIPVEGSRGITGRESRSNAVRGVGWTHSSDEERAYDIRNPWPLDESSSKTTGGDRTRIKPGPAKGSWSGRVEAGERDNACQGQVPESSCPNGKHANWKEWMADAKYRSEASTGKTGESA